jgi:glutamyl-tRNA synthetase
MAAVPPAKGKKAPKVKQMDLPGADKGVVTRFPPEPSGYLHIGHAKAALLNDHFGHVQYPGKVLLRLDDTNPAKEKDEFEQGIIADTKLMGINPDQTSYTSDYFDEIEKYCVQMIKDGNAYADDTPAEIMKAQRNPFEIIHGKKVPKDIEASACRDMTPDETLEKFREMQSGSAEGAKWCIRAKLDYKHVNSALRDPVIYRCPEDQPPHHRTGTKYKAYPTYQFACPVVDSLEGVTHALRTTEYNEQDAQYKWILKLLKLRCPNIWTFSKINFIRTVMSKRKLTQLVDKGIVEGWDDPRLPTIRGMRRRGLSMEALREFMVSQGPSKAVVNMDWNTIWAMNKQIVDKTAARYTAIEGDKVQCTVHGAGETPHSEDKPKHARHPLGDKKVVFSKNIVLEQEGDVTKDGSKDGGKYLTVGEEITLMNWGNVIVKDIKYVEDANGVDGITQSLADQQLADNKKPASTGKRVSHIDFDLHLEGDFKTTKKKITWLSTDQDLVQCKLIDYDYLVPTDKFDMEDPQWMEKLTKVTKFESTAVADCNVRDLKVDDVIQFDKKGYFRCDVAPSKDASAVFIKLPSGK